MSHPPHTVPLWGLFLALLALTAGEVALFEIWHHTAQAGQPFIPKLAMVLLLLAFTLPKAAVVLVYFMHLKFEKQFIVNLAILPFFVAAAAVMIDLTDALILHPQREADDTPSLRQYVTHTASVVAEKP